MSNIQYDSIYIQKDHDQEYHRDKRDSNLSTLNSQLIVDTLFIRNNSVEYKYRLLHDTTYINRVDSIPVIKEVTVTQQVKYVPPWCKWLAWIGIITILLLILFISWKFIKR